LAHVLIRKPVSTFPEHALPDVLEMIVREAMRMRHSGLGGKRKAVPRLVFAAPESHYIDIDDAGDFCAALFA
jgi:hypothetical protein